MKMCVPQLRVAQAVGSIWLQIMSSKASVEDATANEVPPALHMKKQKKDQPAASPEQLAADVGPAQASSFAHEVKPTLELQGRCRFMEQWKKEGQGKTEESAKEPGAAAKREASEDSRTSESSLPSWLLRVSEPDPSAGTSSSEGEDNDQAKNNDKDDAEQQAKDDAEKIADDDAKLSW